MTEYSPEVLEIFARIGQKLNAVREARAMSLNEISVHTKIHPGFLEKIEKGDLENLPNLAFVKGFVRNFIQVLEMDGDELEADLRALTLDSDEEVRPVMPITQMHLLDVEPSRFSLVKLAFYLVLFAALGGIGYFLYIGDGENPASPGKSTETAPAPAKKSNQKETGKNTGTGAKTATGETEQKISGKPSPPAKSGSAPLPLARPAPKNLNLTIRGLERTWVRLTIDQNPPVDVLVEAAETQRWEADQQFRLIIGKSQGVAVFLNGLDFPLLKEPNRLIPEMVLDKLALLKLENCTTQGGC